MVTARNSDHPVGRSSFNPVVSFLFASMGKTSTPRQTRARKKIEDEREGSTVIAESVPASHESHEQPSHEQPSHEQLRKPQGMLLPAIM